MSRARLEIADGGRPLACVVEIADDGRPLTCVPENGDVR